MQKTHLLWFSLATVTIVLNIRKQFAIWRTVFEMMEWTLNWTSIMPVHEEGGPFGCIAVWQRLSMF